MKPISILRKLITLFYYLMGIGLIKELFTLIFRFFSPKMIQPPFLQTEELYSSDTVKVMLLQIIFVLLIITFFRTIQILRQLLNDLANRNHFSEKVTNNFKSVGILFIILSVGELVAKILANYLFGLGFTFPVDSSIVLFPVVGIFFLYLSEIFTEAREIQLENNLTV